MTMQFDKDLLEKAKERYQQILGSRAEYINEISNILIKLNNGNPEYTFSYLPRTSINLSEIIERDGIASQIQEVISDMENANMSSHNNALQDAARNTNLARNKYGPKNSYLDKFYK